MFYKSCRIIHLAANHEITHSNCDNHEKDYIPSNGSNTVMLLKNGCYLSIFLNCRFYWDSIILVYKLMNECYNNKEMNFCKFKVALILQNIEYKIQSTGSLDSTNQYYENLYSTKYRVSYPKSYWIWFHKSAIDTESNQA